MQRKKKPFVSVIIPVFNADKYVDQTLTALMKQTYPTECFEIILIDNESKDETVHLIEKYDVELLINSRSKNPYVSRNIGVKRAKGEVIAFLDITCTPHKKWMEEGVRLLVNGADLVGGRIEYTFSNSPTLGEWYDSITFCNVEKNITEYKRTVGGNVFVKRIVWKKIGSFPENSRSGSDVLWTKKATSAGFKLVFGARATVYYPARDLKGVLRKSFRVGFGHPNSWIEENLKFYRIVWRIVEGFLPPNRTKLQQRIVQRGQEFLEEKFIPLWCIEYISNATRSFGRLIGSLKVYSDKLLNQQGKKK